MIKEANIENIELLIKFNNKDTYAFSYIYKLLYNDLYYFTSSLYCYKEIDASDVIHDNFVKIWNNTKLKFDTVPAIKGYLVISIKNEFKNYIIHKKYENNYKQILKENYDDYFVVKIAEMETFSIITSAKEILPKECAKVFSLYLEGWTVNEIADKLKKSPNTIYTQKNDAIKILKEKIIKRKLLSLFWLIS